jgi:hypothetical protein
MRDQLRMIVAIQAQEASPDSVPHRTQGNISLLPDREESNMAKGQTRGNREKKKPKQSSGDKAKVLAGRSAYQQAMKPKP